MWPADDRKATTARGSNALVDRVLHHAMIQPEYGRAKQDHHGQRCEEPSTFIYLLVLVRWEQYEENVSSTIINAELPDLSTTCATGTAVYRTEEALHGAAGGALKKGFYSNIRRVPC